MNDVLKGKSKNEISSIKRRENLLDKVVKSGKSIEEIKQLDYKEYNKLLGTNISRKKDSLKAQHRLLDQLNYHIDDVTNYHVQKNKITSESYKEFLHTESRKLVRKEGQYTIVEVKYPTESKWIKYDTKKSLERQLAKLTESYGSNYKLLFYKFKNYQSFIDKEFQDLIQKKGIIV